LIKNDDSEQGYFLNVEFTSGFTFLIVNKDIGVQWMNGRDGLNVLKRTTESDPGGKLLKI
jgi:hypothetical protein